MAEWYAVKCKTVDCPEIIPVGPVTYDPSGKQREWPRPDKYYCPICKKTHTYSDFIIVDGPNESADEVC